MEIVKALLSPCYLGTLPITLIHLLLKCPYLTKLIYLNFQPLEVVSRYRDPQSQVIENSLPRSAISSD